MNITINKAVLEQALEALNHGITEMNHRGCAIECMPLHHATKAIREELVQPQPVQETVKGWWAHTCPEDGKVDVVNCQLTPADKRAGWVEHEVYTSPQAQPAQALSNEQITKLPVWRHFVGLMPEHHVEITRAIEQAHGIKGTT